MNRMYSLGIPFFGIATRGVDVLTTPSLLRRQLVDWSADSRVLVDRLLKAIEEQPGLAVVAFRRETTRRALVLVCDHPGGPPRSPAQLVARLDYEVLLEDHGPISNLLLIPTEHLVRLRWRCKVVFSVS